MPRTAAPARIAIPLVALACAIGTGAVSAAAAPRVSVLHVALVTQQDVPAISYSEPDTVVEPDVVVSPLDPMVAVAASHDGRYPDGGAVGISYAWTHDGGATWHHQPVPGLTRTTGGAHVWARASDPVLAFAADGDVYLSTLIFGQTCPSAVAVSRSTDGGVTFGAPVLADYSATCDFSDDKNTIVVDNSPASPHYGRIYQFWTPFLTDPFGNSDGSPQALVYSDDHGRTWSGRIAVSAPHANSQNSTPMVQPDGTVVDAYIDYGDQAQQDEDTEFRGDADARAGAADRVRSPAAAGSSYPRIVTAVSTDGGRSFQPGGVVTTAVGEGPNDIRCCLDSATADPATGRLLVAWTSPSLTTVLISRSSDGVTWTAAAPVNRPTDAYDAVNVDVAASGGTVAVSYGLADAAHLRYADQYVAVSHDGGRSFPATVGIGPRSHYRWAAMAPVIFPGDYIGTALSSTGRLYAVWCVSSKPADPSARYHQVVYGATLTT